MLMEKKNFKFFFNEDIRKIMIFICILSRRASMLILYMDN